MLALQVPVTQVLQVKVNITLINCKPVTLILQLYPKTSNTSVTHINSITMGSEN